MTEEKMREYGEFSVRLEIINKAKLSDSELEKRIAYHRQELDNLKAALRIQSLNLDELEQKIMEEVDNFSFN